MRRRIARSVLLIAASTTLLLAGATAGRPDEKPGEVTIAPSWKAGDALHYERVKSRKRMLGGEVKARGSGRGMIDVTVVEAGEKGYLVRWRIGSTTPDDLRSAADPSARALNRLVGGLAIDLELDAEATITGVRNWSEMKAAAAKMADTVFKAQQDPGVDERTAAAARTMIESMFATKERVELLFTKEPQVLFFPIGRTYPGVGKPVDYDDQLPNPLGGPPFPCKGRIVLTAYDAARGRATVNWTQATDPEVTTRIMLEFLKTLAERSGKAAPNADAIKDFKMEDRAEFVIDTRTGWVERFTQTRTTTTQGGSQEDTLSMTRKAKSE